MGLKIGCDDACLLIVPNISIHAIRCDPSFDTLLRDFLRDNSYPTVARGLLIATVKTLENVTFGGEISPHLC